MAPFAKTLDSSLASACIILILPARSFGGRRSNSLIVSFVGTERGFLLEPCDDEDALSPPELTVRRIIDDKFGDRSSTFPKNLRYSPCDGLLPSKSVHADTKQSADRKPCSLYFLSTQACGHVIYVSLRY